ncbi:MAG: hypothetical protein JW836_03055, partial [Deltaproteobacteria bacterium]|nr:hypothetical protein [Deltaproteobacteria bacterium]
SKMQASVRLSPEGWPSATPAGFFIEEEEGDLFCLLEMLHRLQDAASLDSLPRIVCLGNGALLPIIREKDKIDTEVMSGQMEEIMDAYPNLRLWLEPGRHLVSHACILLSRAEHVNTQTVAQDRLGGPLHGFYNLSRPEERVQRNHCGEHKKGLVGILSGAEAEDILAVTNMGGCRLQMIGSHAPVEEHYLKARRICRVKL